MKEPTAQRVEIYKGHEVDVAVLENTADWFVRIMVTPERVPDHLPAVPILKWDIYRYVGDLNGAFATAFTKARRHLDLFPNVARDGYRKGDVLAIPGSQAMNDGTFRAIVQMWQELDDGRVRELPVRTFPDLIFADEASARAHAIAFAEGRN